MALIQEGKTLKSRGYDLLIIGEFNGHIGEIDNGTENMNYKNRNPNFNGNLVLDLVLELKVCIANELEEMDMG